MSYPTAYALTQDDRDLLRAERAKRARNASMVNSIPRLSLVAEAAKIGIDVSSYEPILKADELSGHIAWIGAKAGEVDDTYRSYKNGQPWNSALDVDLFCDTTFADHVQTAYNCKVPLVAYVFDNPCVPRDFYASAYADHVKNPNDRDPRILMLRHQLANKAYHAICIDVERWWLYYSEYLAYLRGTLDGAKVQKVEQLWILNSVADLYQRIKEDMSAGKIKTCPIWIYTGKWFVDSYCPQLDTFLADKLQWLADYTTTVYTATKGATSWAKVSDAVTAATFNPKWVGNKRCEVLQLTDATNPGGVYTSANVARTVDLDVALASMSTLFVAGDWGTVTPPPPPVTTTPDLTELTVRVAAAEATITTMSGTMTQLEQRIASLEDTRNKVRQA